MDQRIEFAMKALSCSNFGELCREYGISRKTGYKWRERFVAEGLAGMQERSRRPNGHPSALSEALVCEIVRLKNAHSEWGPRKIRELYGRSHPGGELPSESSFKRVLENAGLTEPRQRRKAREAGRLASGRKAQTPNDVWTVDFKGWWRNMGGQRVEPLTVRDEHSRMILELRAVDNSRTETIRHCFERLFEQHGLPGALRSDNGPPFACHNGLHGLTRLSAWWLALGIDLERGRPGCPQDNGAHERMHRDISRELQARRTEQDQQQNAFDLWRHEFNTERPHEALGMACPADIYEPSSRPYTGTPDQLDYQGRETRRVHSTGSIKFNRERIPISSSLAGWDVGLGDRDGDRIELWFANLLLGHLDEGTLSFHPAQPQSQPQPENPNRGAASVPRDDSATLHRLEGRRGTSGAQAKITPKNNPKPNPNL